MPSTVCILTCGPTASKRRGTMSTWTSSLLQRARRARPCRSAARRRRRPPPGRRRAARRAPAARSAGRAPAGRPSSVRSSRGFASTKPTRLMPYSGCWRKLAGDQLADVAGADDDRVLEVGGLRRHSARAEAREPVTNAIASAQNVTTFADRARPGRRATPPRRRARSPTVTRWKTPTRSSSVVWSARSSSWSYRR